MFVCECAHFVLHTAAFNYIVHYFQYQSLTLFRTFKLFLLIHWRCATSHLKCVVKCERASSFNDIINNYSWDNFQHTFYLDFGFRVMRKIYYVLIGALSLHFALSLRTWDFVVVCFFLFLSTLSVGKIVYLYIIFESEINSLSLSYSIDTHSQSCVWCFFFVVFPPFRLIVCCLLLTHVIICLHTNSSWHFVLTNVVERALIFPCCCCIIFTRCCCCWCYRRVNMWAFIAHHISPIKLYCFIAYGSNKHK